MWKRFVILLVLNTFCMILLGCSANNNTAGSSEKGTETSGEDAAASDEEAYYTIDDLGLNFGATIDETVLLDESDIKVIAKSLTYTDYSADLEVLLENNTATDYDFVCGTAGYPYTSVNGFCVSGGYFNQEVAAGTSETVTASFSLDEMALLGFTDIAEIGIGVQVKEEYDTFLESGLVTMKTSAADTYDITTNSFIEVMDGDILPSLYKYTINKSEKDVLNKGDVSIESIYVFTNKDNNQCVFIQAYNSGDKILYASTRDIFVNEEQAYEGLWSQSILLPEKRAILSIDLSRVIDDYKNSEVAVRGAESIDFTFRLTDRQSTEIWTEPIAIELNQ